MKRILVVIAALAATTTALFALPLTTPAELPRGIAYTGRLERDGAGLNGTSQLRFRLYDGTTLLWTSALKTVTLAAGAFSTVLGESPDPALGDAVFNSQNLQLGVTVDGVDLVGTQRIHAAPFANRATSAFEAGAQGSLDVRLSSLEARVTPLETRATSLETRVGRLESLQARGAMTFNGNLDVGNDQGAFWNGSGDYRVHGFTTCPEGRVFRVGYTGSNGIVTVYNRGCGPMPCFQINTRSNGDISLFGSSLGFRSFLCAGGAWWEL